MKITLVNPPHTAIGSRIPREHLPPLGLLSVGGPLIDAGHSVSLLDAELAPLGLDEIVTRLASDPPEVVMIGHSGSSSVHATVVDLCARIKVRLPGVIIVYGGVYPTYCWREILAECPAVDLIVRGEGERTTVRLMEAVARGGDLGREEGIAYRSEGRVIGTAQAPMIRDLDEFRVGWELIDHRDYSYWGGKRAVVVQFSRGCPYQCSYCGQRGFWTQRRHRDPVRFARELARLHREHGVELINFADELPTGSPAAWKAFLEALIAENVPLLLVGSTRAGDIVRDRDILHLYRRAGVIRFLLGMRATTRTPCTRSARGARRVRISWRSNCCGSMGSSRWRPTWWASTRSGTGTIGPRIGTCCGMTRTRCSCSTRRRIGGLRFMTR